MSYFDLFRVWNETMKQAWDPWSLTLQLHRARGHTCGSGLRCLVHCTLSAQFQEILLTHPEFTIMGIKAWFHRILHCPCPKAASNHSQTVNSLNIQLWHKRFSTKNILQRIFPNLARIRQNHLPWSSPSDSLAADLAKKKLLAFAFY